MQLKERKGVVSDLLESKTKMTILFKPDNAVRMSIPAYGARVWKMKA